MVVESMLLQQYVVPSLPRAQLAICICMGFVMQSICGSGPPWGQFSLIASGMYRGDLTGCRTGNGGKLSNS